MKLAQWLDISPKFYRTLLPSHSVTFNVEVMDFWIGFWLKFFKDPYILNPWLDLFMIFAL